MGLSQVVEEKEYLIELKCHWIQIDEVAALLQISNQNLSYSAMDALFPKNIDGPCNTVCHVLTCAVYLPSIPDMPIFLVCSSLTSVHKLESLTWSRLMKQKA